MQISLLNGESTLLPLDHRSVAYGDGLFETLLFQNGTIQFLSEHLERLRKGADILRLKWSDHESKRLQDQLVQLLVGEEKPHVVKVQLLREFSGRGYAYEGSDQKTDVIIQIGPYGRPEWCSLGVNLALANTPVSQNEALAGLKHLNRLDSVVARAEYPVAEYEELVLITGCGSVVEGTMSNLLLKLENRWVTPPIIDAGVNGIIRQLLLSRELILEKTVDKEEMLRVESAFICNSLIGIVPVLSYNQRPLVQCVEFGKIKEELSL